MKKMIALVTIVFCMYASSMYADGGDRIAFTNELDIPITLTLFSATADCDSTHNVYPDNTTLKPRESQLFFMHAKNNSQCGITILATGENTLGSGAGTISFVTDDDGHFITLTSIGWTFLMANGITAVGPSREKNPQLNYAIYQIKLYQML